MTNTLSVIARHLFTKAHSTALRYAKRSHDAEEIAQDALVKLCSNHRQALRAASSAAYLDTTIRNAAYDYFRNSSSFASYNQILGVAEISSDISAYVTSCARHPYDQHL